MDNAENALKNSLNKSTTPFSRFASTYSENASVQSHVFDYLLEKFNEVATIQPQTILDFGCGPGTHTLKFLEAFKTPHIIGMDISSEMVAEAKKTQNNATFLTADEFKDSQETFDLILASSVFQWVDDWNASLTSLYERLNSQGWLALSIFGPQTFHELAHSLSILMGRPQQLPASRFRTAHECIHILDPIMNIKVKTSSLIKKSYPSVIALLKSIQHTGTSGWGLSEKRVWTPGFIKQLEQVYQSLYGGIYASHHVYFIIAQKP